MPVGVDFGVVGVDNGLGCIDTIIGGRGGFIVVVMPDFIVIINFLVKIRRNG